MNSYFYDSTALRGLINSLKIKLDDYNGMVERITTLKSTIESSGEWEQDIVKTPFISKCDEYLAFFTGMETKLEAYINYLESKNKAMESLESAYSA